MTDMSEYKLAEFRIKPSNAGSNILPAVLGGGKSRYQPLGEFIPGGKGSGGSGATETVGEVDVQEEGWAQIQNIRGELSIFSQNISALVALHVELASNPDSKTLVDQHQSKTDALRAEARDLSSKIKSLVNNPICHMSQSLINQTKALSERHRGLLAEWQDEEKSWRKKTRDRAERHIRIVKPDATEEEIIRTLDTGLEGQIFSQALMSRSRQAGAHSAFKAVQERQEEMRRIERTLEELATMFSDMSMLIEQQDEVLTVIETNTKDTAQDMSRGVEDLEIGAVTARKTRSKRKLCFLISLGVGLALIVIVLVVLQVQFKIFSGGKK